MRTSLALSSSMDAKSTLHRAGMMSVSPCLIANSAAGEHHHQLRVFLSEFEVFHRIFLSRRKPLFAIFSVSSDSS